MKTEEHDQRSQRRARWMAAAQRGDVAAYRALLDDIGPLVTRFLRRRVGDREEVRDLYQDVLLALHRARHTYEPSRPLEPWLLAIARHVVADHQRRRAGRRRREVLVEVTPDRAVEAESTLKVQLEQALRRLSGEQRQAIRLLRLDGLGVETAAARAGTTTGALKVRAHRAFKLLRQLL
jgi:RNA polymerase sigma-70 factor (ECF subfamily)